MRGWWNHERERQLQPTVRRAAKCPTESSRVARQFTPIYVPPETENMCPRKTSRVRGSIRRKWSQPNDRQPTGERIF